jgi:hypothetical protein
MRLLKPSAAYEIVCVECCVYTVPMSSQPSAQMLHPSHSKRRGLGPTAVGFLLFFLVGWSLLALRPPEPIPISAPFSKFSAARAIQHVLRVSHEPHPIGSAANLAVRKYLVEELSALGMNPRVFSSFGVGHLSSGIVAGKVEDVLGRAPGTSNTGAIVLVAHYDSVYRGPGAADDGAGVATLLETVRALHSSPPLKNDLIVLFTDGEEAGLLGAEAFARSHPWMKDVGLILNFEARGNGGPSVLFETGAESGALIDQVKQIAPYPITSSFFETLYRLLPNDTDFSVFRRAGVPGLNFAFGEGLEVYHSMLDTPGNLSLASIQHHGSYALALTRRFGEIDLKEVHRTPDDSVFFNWLGSHMVSYPGKWIFPGEILLTLLVTEVIFLAVRKSGLKVKSLLSAFLSVSGIAVAIPVLSYLPWKIASVLLAGRPLATDSLGTTLLLISFLFFDVALAVFAFVLLRRSFDTLVLSRASLILLSALSCVTALAMPSGSYILSCPALLLAIGFLMIELTNRGSNSTYQLAVTLPGLALMIFIFAPLVYLCFVFLTLQFIVITAASFLIWLVFLAAFPLINFAIASFRPGFLSLLLAFVCFVAVATTLHYDDLHPKADTITYNLNANTGTAKWISLDPALDEWTTSFFPSGFRQRQPEPDYLAGFQKPVFAAPADSLDILPPIAKIETDEVDGTIHKLHLVIKSQRASDIIYLGFPPDIRPLSTTIAGIGAPLTANPVPFFITLRGMSKEAVDVNLKMDAPSGITFWLLDASFGLPQGRTPRPPRLMAGDGSDMTVISQKYMLQP